MPLSSGSESSAIQRNRTGVSANLFLCFTYQGCLNALAKFEMTTYQIPMIWIPGFVRRSLYQKNQTIPHKKQRKQSPPKQPPNDEFGKSPASAHALNELDTLCRISTTIQRRKNLPSMTIRLAMINAIPANSNGSSLSPRNTALSMVALTGTRSVTRDAFVAPAEAMMLK